VSRLISFFLSPVIGDLLLFANAKIVRCIQWTVLFKKCEESVFDK